MTARSVLSGVSLAIALVIGWNAWSAWRDGWVAEGDSAAITIRTGDVFSSHPPLLGQPTSAAQTGGPAAAHPGPAEFYALALPARLVGGSTAGMLLGAALVNAAAVLGIGWSARRNASTHLAAWITSSSAVLVFALGDEILHDVYNPHIALLPMAWLGLLVWAAGRGDRLALPVAAGVVSFVAQAHALLVLPAAVLACAVLVAAWLAGPPSRRTWLLAGATGFVLWLPPLLAELGSRPSNVAALFRVARGEGAEGPAVGVGFGLARLADVLLRARWLDPSPTPAELLHRPGAVARLLAVVVVLALAALAAVAWRSGRRSSAVLVLASLSMAVASTATSARLTVGTPLLEPHSHRHWTVTGWFVSMAASWICVDLVPVRLRRTLGRPVALGLALVPFVVAAPAAAWRPSIADDRGSANFGAIARLTDRLHDRIEGTGPWSIRAEGSQAFLSIQPGVVAGLLHRGADVRVPSEQRAVLGEQHVVDGPVVGTVLVVSAPEPPPVPAGYELVVRFDAPADATARGHTNAGFASTTDQVAVFLREG